MNYFHKEVIYIQNISYINMFYVVCRNILFLYIPLIPPPKTKPHRPGTKGQLFSGFQKVFGVSTVP